MSKTQPNPRYQYDEMSDSVARHHLANDFGSDGVKKWMNRNHIISPTDVLYYADAYGDLDNAILLQAFDKTLPERVHKGLLETGWDIFEAVNCNDLDKKLCPGCDTEMWDIEIQEGQGYTSHNWLDEYGNTLDFEEFVENVDGRFWSADWQEGDSPVLCYACACDIHYDFPRNLSDNGSVVVHYGETDEVSAFAVWNGLVRWDFEAYWSDGWTDLWGLPGDATDVPAAFATRNVVSHFEGIGWGEIAESTAMDALPAGSRGLRAKKQYRRLATEWSDGEEAHPDLGFTYIIDHATFGNPSFWVADENRDELMDEITDLIERRI